MGDRGYSMRRSSIYCVRLRRQSVYVLDACSNVLQIAVAAVSYCTVRRIVLISHQRCWPRTKYTFMVLSYFQ